MRILILGTVPNDLLNFRADLIKDILKKNHEVLAHGIKLVIWGGIASSLRNIPFYALITGLGFAFQGKSLKRRFLTKLASFLYKLALRNSKAVIFQNKDNRDLFIITARVKNNKKELQKYKFSGGLFKVKTNIKGKLENKLKHKND